MTLAIFDIDGTLVRGSSERQFWRYLAARGRQGPRQILAYLLFLVRYCARAASTPSRRTRPTLSGLRTSDVAALAEDFVQTRLLQRLNEPAVQRLKQHLLRGDTVVLMSGTLQPIAAALARSLGVRLVSATLCSERDGRYLAAAARDPSVRRSQAELAKQLADSWTRTCRKQAPTATRCTIFPARGSR